MPRIDGVSDRDASVVQKAMFRAAKGRVGQVPDPLRLMAHSSGVMWAAGFYEIASGRASKVSANLKGLAALKVAGLVGCVF
mgnify:CR=1 FL=1